MNIHQEKAEAIKEAVIVLEKRIAEAEAAGLKVDVHYQSKEPQGYRYLETVIVLPILDLP